MSGKLNWRGQVVDRRLGKKYVSCVPERVRIPLRESFHLDVADIPGDGWEYVRRFRMLRCLLTGHLRWSYEFGHMYPAVACYRCHGRLG